MNSVPLIDILPWGFDSPPCSRQSPTIVICDSNETDGRFLLHTIASQCLSSKTSATATSSMGNSNISAKREPYHVIWVNCGAKTETNIRSAMKKIGCDTRLHDNLVHIIPIIPYLSEKYAQEAENEDGVESEEILKQVYLHVKEKIKTMKKYVIIIDNCTMLSTYFGAAMTFTFVQKMKTMIRKATSGERKENCLVALVSNDLDQDIYVQSTEQGKKSVAGSKKLQYIGLGGRGMLHDAETMAGMELDARNEFDELVWERSLIELSDSVVDVVCLSSGFAKDVHGRLVFTTSRSSSKSSTTVVNYCCNDTGVRAIRINIKNKS